MFYKMGMRDRRNNCNTATEGTPLITLIKVQQCFKSGTVK